MKTNLDEKAERLIFKGQTLSLCSPIVMGILNVTPDSFSDGGSYLHVNQAVDRVRKMLEEGAKIIDIGGESTRPGSDFISEQEEIDRVIPVIEKIRSDFPHCIISIDTTKYSVAKAALELGAHFINDISGLQKDPRFVDLCETYDAGLILMHSKGEPKTMQQAPHYVDVMKELKAFFFYQLQLTSERLLDRVILDPGFGFGKTAEHNLIIANHLKELTHYGCPILVGASRKTIISSILGGVPVEQRLTGTIAFHYDLLTKGAKILRVHDVKEAVESVKVFNSIQSQKLV